jgi:hypothetical protein
VIANLIVDILYSIADPRIRMSSSGGLISVRRRRSKELRGTAQPRVSESTMS